MDYLLFLPVGDPKDMAGIQVYDVGGITVAVVELELINGEHLCRLLRPDQSCAVNGVEFFQANQIDVFDGVLAKACNLGDLLESICAKRKEVACILVEFHGYLMAVCFERNRLHM